MAPSSAPHSAVADDVLPEESASNVSRASTANTHHVRSSRRAAAAAKYRIMQQQLELERSIAELEAKDKLAELERAQLKMERARIEEEQALALARDRTYRKIQRRKMQMSLKDLSAASEAVDDVNSDAMLNCASQVSKTSIRITTDVLQDREETVQENEELLISAPITSHINKTNVLGPSLSVPEVHYPASFAVATSSSVFASTSIATSTAFKVHDFLNSLTLSPLISGPSPERPSSTVHRPVATTTASSEYSRDTTDLNLNRTIFQPRSAALSTTTTAPVGPPVTTQQYRLYGDGERTVNFREPYYDTNVPQQAQHTQSDPGTDLAAAISKLAVANQASMLPKSEIIKFDGSARNFQRFLNSFDLNIGSKDIDDSAKLTYLIQYCDGKARQLIEDCVMMDPTAGYAEARHLLRKEYGKRHEIARSCIDSLTRGPAIAANDYEGIIELAREMQRCQLTLTQIKYVSDLQSSQTMYAIVRRLPEFLQQKWMEKSVWYDKMNREPSFQDFLDFMQDRALVYKTSIGQEIIRNKQEKKKAQKPDLEEKKKTKNKPAKTLATSSNQASLPPPMDSTSGSTQHSTTRSSSNTSSSDRRRVCKHCSKDHGINECEQFKALDVQKRFEFAK